MNNNKQKKNPSHISWMLASITSVVSTVPNYSKFWKLKFTEINVSNPVEGRQSYGATFINV